MLHLPLTGITVVEFTHVVMGPLVGKVLQDLGAEVLHVEPPGGDPTRRMQGFGKGFFTFYNHGKKTEEVDLKSAAGQTRIQEVLAKADVVVENYGPGVMDKLGLGAEALRNRYPSLIYCSLKGFMPGPYENRIAVDEVVQMMGGLAYMTGNPGKPMRAGTSALDITGGLFGVIGILSALFERKTSGIGKTVRASLFESSAFLMGQFMAGVNPEEPETIPPMPAREQIWAIYQLFDTSDNKQVFIGVISDKHWVSLCLAFAWHDLLKDERWLHGAKRLAGQTELVAEVKRRINVLPYDTIIEACLRENVPFGEVNTPVDLLSNEHLNSGYLEEVSTVNGQRVKIPKLPILFG
ncbi:MAG: CaiB/BaiF CoA transferase family protein [Saprospiraceae bacterium]